jgi:hypothetical protein
MKRRDALKSLVVSGAAAALPAGASTAPTTELSEDQLRAMLRLVGMELRAGEGAAILASFNGNRFTADVDPAIQATDFDADVDA